MSLGSSLAVRRRSSARSSGYASNVHQGYKRIKKRSSVDEKFFISHPIVFANDLYKTKLLTSLIREEKIKDINARVTRPTAATNLLPPYFTQDQLLDDLNRSTHDVLLNKDGGLRKKYPAIKPLAGANYKVGDGLLPPAPGSLRPAYHRLWTYPTMDSFEKKWLSGQRHMSCDFIPQTSNWNKSYSIYKRPPRHVSRY